MDNNLVICGHQQQTRLVSIFSLRRPDGSGYLVLCRASAMAGRCHMNGENEAQTVDSEAQAQTETPKRERSSIAFPYDNLAEAEQLALAIHQHVGPGDCEEDQLAAWLTQSPKSSGFRTQVSAARMFGLIEAGAPGHRLTDLGRRIVDPTQA